MSNLLFYRRKQKTRATLPRSSLCWLEKYEGSRRGKTSDAPVGESTNINDKCPHTSGVFGLDRLSIRAAERRTGSGERERDREKLIRPILFHSYYSNKIRKRLFHRLTHNYFFFSSSLTLCRSLVLLKQLVVTQCVSFSATCTHDND